jgi:TPR repeat protein
MHTCSTTFLAVLLLILSSISWSADVAKGQEAYNTGDYQTALAEWQPLAEQGHAESQFGMGLLYANGFGVPLDDDQALKWYRLAADQGHAQALCNLAVMHANGWGVPQSDEEAFKWYSLAAEHGATEAQSSLGTMYSGGFGAAQDNVQAHKWFTIASELGDQSAAFTRDDLAARMSAEEIAEAERLANEWIESHQDLQANH